MIVNASVRWYNTVGFVLVYDDLEECHKCYVGVGRGLSESSDRDHIKDWGMKVDEAVARAMFPRINITEYGWE